MLIWGLSVLSIILYALEVNVFLETFEVDTITSPLRLKKLTQ